MRSSPGIIILLDLIETSGVDVVASGLLAVLHGREHLPKFPEVGPLVLFTSFS